MTLGDELAGRIITDQSDRKRSGDNLTESGPSPSRIYTPPIPSAPDPIFPVREQCPPDCGTLPVTKRIDFQIRSDDTTVGQAPYCDLSLK